ncbi:MAG: hypothetical protein KatS3mg085_713 [Candidatus Dojkabacteria bacterium]|nr:MAG: hypothetical protein KatS3mg085_713 [Candidatus Dojkabacteria bacterium]
MPLEYFEENFDKDTKDAINQITESLRSSGYSIENVSIPSSKFGLSVYYILVPSEISSNRARYDGVRYGPFVSEEYEENLVEGRSKYFEDEVKRRIMIGTYALSAGYGDELYLKATKVRNKIKQEFDEAFKKVDILLAPTSPSKAFKLGEKINDPISMYLTDLYTVNANITGIPAINIPLGIKDRLPIGMQLMAQRWNDEYLFQASRVIRELS